MSRLFALLVLVAVIAVANAQYYGGYYGGGLDYGYSGIGYGYSGLGYGGYSGLGLGYGAYYKK
ncbi:hypothetical protein Ocin01_15377 [Orchesella cincta]|uniref:Uncharacterized protein n=1 Tax=Orchesella cincta TaxID=48709 RepID=A0A1D2ME62_ORCCI|nr:hypothetical protein Ocin01_17873 [Orchesella cincta]ODM91307.1 hypothetical protein Ocin01_15377 [Orchesella cincta]